MPFEDPPIYAPPGDVAPAPAAVPSTFRFAFHGRGGDFAEVVLHNLFLTLITLGFYAGWAKTNRRAYLWGSADFHGQRFAYTGKGIEILKGYAKVIGIYLLFILCTAGLKRLPTPFPMFGGIALSLAILFVLPYAIYASRAYLLRVTRWRGIRFGLAANGLPGFSSAFIKGAILTPFTLGIYFPIYRNRIFGEIVRNARFGTEAFDYDGADREAARIFYRSVPLIVVTLGYYYFTYRAKTLRFRAEHVRFAGARGAIAVEPSELAGLFFSNLLLLLCTFGLAFPWVVTRKLRFYLERFRLDGAIDFDRIAQTSGSADATGDALADALDVDLGI